MSSLEQMYQQVILDHAKHPVGRGLVAVDADHLHGESHQVNPTCGDEVTLRVDVLPGVDGGPARVAGVSWEGQGCSISQASVSVMTELVSDQPLDEVARLDALFHDLMGSRGKGLDDEGVEDDLGDATAFTGVSKYPARIKCALLGWAALKDSLVRSGASATND
ncbi:Fe-S cluster assembly sulfur transfer protein SufU [Myceligenerans salitolerans]|uniref:SUF system NifU family Fe-S cluster assembly protein n=1 Tax=Myceligenerans salitolerans TaxID=1230528 RepID=A0ABS3I6S1_9MICO|nr:SUF system NifU family Fe-S cluster assembly protein [Myceligenerans salitolerans]MBO0607787.1 SUF system NifU family Fe-S cluster assembly protein [Myceligenerans salitolerans]